MNADIVRKIKKTLALAAHDSGATEGERDNALRQAYALMRKHSVNQSDIDKGERGLHTNPRHNHAWCRVCANGLAALFFCKYFFVRKLAGKIDHTFVGKDANTITTSDMLDYVSSSISRESKGSRSFCNGAADALAMKCKKMREEAEAQSTEPGTGMALVSAYKQERSKNEAYLASINIHTKVKSSHRSASDATAYGAGKTFGNAINLSKQITGDKK